jgi:hypothetical protein
MSSRNKTNASTSRRKRTTSSSAPTHDANRFLSAVKEEYYEKILADLKCVPEREIPMEEGVVDEFGVIEAIEKRQWETLATPVDDGCEVLVKEFLANTRHDDLANRPTTRVYESYFQGKHLSYDPAVIRTFLDLRTPQQERELFPTGLSYHQIMRTEVPVALKEEILGLTVIPGGKVHKDAAGKILHTDRPCLMPIARVWAHFIQETIIPSSQLSEVRWPVLVFIYCILKGRPIDVAQIIADKIYDHCNDPKKRHPRPVYPLLISSLVMMHHLGDQYNEKYEVQKHIGPLVFSVSEMKRIYTMQYGKLPQDLRDQIPIPAPVQPEFVAAPRTHQLPDPHLHDYQPQWLAEAFGRMFTRQERQHRAIDLLWEAGHHQNPAYPFVQPFDDLEQRLVSLSLHGQSSGGRARAADGEHQEGTGGDYDPMSD